MDIPESKIIASVLIFFLFFSFFLTAFNPFQLHVDGSWQQRMHFGEELSPRITNCSKHSYKVVQPIRAEIMCIQPVRCKQWLGFSRAYMEGFRVYGVSRVYTQLATRLALSVVVVVASRLILWQLFSSALFCVSAEMQFSVFREGFLFCRRRISWNLQHAFDWPMLVCWWK